jgi:hypothetical protein
LAPVPGTDMMHGPPMTAWSGLCPARRYLGSIPRSPAAIRPAFRRGDDETGKGRREIGSTVMQRFLARKKTVEARVWARGPGPRGGREPLSDFTIAGERAGAGPGERNPLNWRRVKIVRAGDC